MEGAGFISAYPRPNAQQVSEQLQADSTLDENMARLVSRREGIDVVLAGQIEERGSGYRISVQALDAAVDSEDSKPLAKASEKADDRDDVLAAVGRLASDLRQRLGDTETESSRMAAAETFTAASLDAMRAYAKGQELASQGNFEVALGAYEEAVSLDPEFGRAYAGMGTVYGNLREQEKAEESYQKALQHLERMTERERYRTLGTYYLLVSRNYEKAIENYETLVELFPADGAAHSNLALAYVNNRQFDRAYRQGGIGVELDPNHFIKRINFAMYAMYAGEFEISMEESRKVMEQKPSFGYAHFTLARSAIGAGDLDLARQAYDQLDSEEMIGAELAPLGQGDLALYLGDTKAAITVLEATVGTGDEGPVAAAQLIVLAEAYLALGENEYAKQVAQRAIDMSNQESVLYPAARVMLEAGDIEAADKIAIDLENKLQSQTVSYARLIQGEIALKDNRLLPAVESLKDGWERYDSWFAHYLLGRAYLEAEHYPEALGEFEICLEREGEALDLFVVDGATSRYLAPVHYWLGRAREGLASMVTARESYERYLSLRGEAEPPDPLAEDAAQRLASMDLARAS